MISISIDYISNFAFAYVCTREEPRTGNLTNFTPEDEDEAIGDLVLQKFYRPLVNPSNKVCRDSKQTKTPIPPFQIGDSIRYTNEAQN